MHYSQGCCAVLSWREHSRSSQLVALLRGAQDFIVTVLLTVQRLCMAPADDGEIFGSSSSHVQVELCSGADSRV
jgi:hypothetical protein